METPTSDESLSNLAYASILLIMMLIEFVDMGVRHRSSCSKGRAT